MSFLLARGDGEARSDAERSLRRRDAARRNVRLSHRLSAQSRPVIVSVKLPVVRFSFPTRVTWPVIARSRPVPVTGRQRRLRWRSSSKRGEPSLQRPGASRLAFPSEGVRWLELTDAPPATLALAWHADNRSATVRALVEIARVAAHFCRLDLPLGRDGRNTGDARSFLGRPVAPHMTGKPRGPRCKASKMPFSAAAVSDAIRHRSRSR